MATYASRPAWGLRARALSETRAAVLIALGLGGLVAVSLVLRTGEFDVGFWIDEGLSVGIADRPVGDIPGVLRLDGSPPLYYILVHYWIQVAGRTEEAMHALSLIFALATVPVAFGAGWRLFGARAAWIGAALAATNPFLTAYGQEARMYSLVVLLGLVACWAFMEAFVLRRRAWLAVFALAMTALLYTHNYALFFVAATAAAWAVLLVVAGPGERRALVRDGLIAFGALALLYAPWIPSMLFQAEHTGAPWARQPGIEKLIGAPGRVLGDTAAIALLLAAGAGLATLVERRQGGRLTDRGRATLALIIMAVGTLLLAWLSSQLSPAWATRYLAIGLAPLLLMATAGLAHAGRLGVVGLVLVLVLWVTDGPPKDKSNVRDVAEAIAPSLRPGDLVIATQPEQIPVLHYYLPKGLRYATLWGPVEDTGITDWRDGPERLERTSPERDLLPLLRTIPPGGRVVLLEPTVYEIKWWSAPWTSLVRVRSEQWARAMSNQPALRVSAIYPPSPLPRRPNPQKATVLLNDPIR